MRKDLADRFAGVAVGGERGDLDAIVGGKDAQQLGAGITAGTKNGDLHALFGGIHLDLPATGKWGDEKRGVPQDAPFAYADLLPDQRFENWKLRRAFALPYFLRSTTRLSRVR